ncbi:MAG: YfhO family protein, partial [Flavobacteriales bacterium]
KKTLKAEYIVLIITVLCVVDILPFDKAFFPKEKFQKVHKQKSAPDIEATAADNEILKDKSLNYRVLNLTGDVFNEANTSYFHKSVGGYHPAKLRRYQDLIENYIPQEAQVEAQKAIKMDSSAFASANVLNMLNTKYVILSPESNGVITNKHALGNAWLVDTLKIVNTAKEEIDALGKINPKRTALIAESSFTEGALSKKVFSAQGTIQLTSYAPNKLEYATDVSADAFAVFSEVYYPYGWKASIDEQEVNHVRVDYTLRGLPIPAGKHKVTFVFDPDSFKLGKRLSSISSILILLLFAGVVFVEYRKRKAKA